MDDLVHSALQHGRSSEFRQNIALRPPSYQDSGLRIALAIKAGAKAFFWAAGQRCRWHLYRSKRGDEKVVQGIKFKNGIGVIE
jgi:hypothetical protein